MSDTVLLIDNDDLVQFYTRFFTNTLHTNDRVLYVGYEENDFLLPIIAQYKVNILAVDRENRSNETYDNVQYIQIDFENIQKAIGTNRFDWVIFSFMLHENPSVIHQKFIDIARTISDCFIIIEPLPRDDALGREFEKELSEFYARKNQIKCYYSAEYWEKLVNYNPDMDTRFILKRGKSNHDRIPIMFHGKKVLLSLQDIAIFICKK